MERGMLTYFGRCAGCRAELRIFSHALGKPKRALVLRPKAQQDDFETAFEAPGGAFHCPRCNASGRVIEGIAVCPEAGDA